MRCSATDKVGLKRSAVHLVDEDLERIAHDNKPSENNDTGNREWDLQQLCPESLKRRVDLNRLSRNNVLRLMIKLELRSWVLNLGHSPNTPLHGEINLLLLPELKENHGPQTARKSVEEREPPEEKPSTESERRGEHQEPEIALDEGEIESDALAELVANLVEVILVEEILRAQPLHPLAVEVSIVKREHRVDVFPLPALRRNSRTPLVLRFRYRQVYEPQPLRLAHRLLHQRSGQVGTGSRRPHALKPVL